MADPKDRFPVEASHIMMFARSVGDANPIYHDAEYAKGTEPGGIIAPPTFPQASAQFSTGYRLRPEIGKPWFGSGATPSGTMMPPGEPPMLKFWVESSLNSRAFMLAERSPSTVEPAGQSRRTMKSEGINFFMGGRLLSKIFHVKFSFFQKQRARIPGGRLLFQRLKIPKGRGTRTLKERFHSG